MKNDGLNFIKFCLTGGSIDGNKYENRTFSVEFAHDEVFEQFLSEIVDKSYSSKCVIKLKHGNYPYTCKIDDNSMVAHGIGSDFSKTRYTIKIK